MPRLLPLGLGVTAGALYVRARRGRQHAERLGAALLETLLNAIDANDPVTGAHVRRVARYALILGEAADLDEHTCRSIERVALFHDIGKIHQALFDVIHESTALTPEERELVATHPRRGAEVLAPLAAFYPDLAEGVLSHHERWDGTGYPRKLKGEEIPFAARVVAIADTFDAITHGRRYHHGRPKEQATRTVADGRGSQFDPTLVDLFLSPPVREDVRRAMRESARASAGEERSAGASVAVTSEVPTRRAKPKEAPAPDLTFRWRTKTPAPLPPDRGTTG